MELVSSSDSEDSICSSTEDVSSVDSLSALSDWISGSLAGISSF